MTVRDLTPLDSKFGASGDLDHNSQFIFGSEVECERETSESLGLIFVWSVRLEKGT